MTTLTTQKHQALQKFKQAEQLPLDLAIEGLIAAAEADQVRRKVRLTKADAVSPDLVDVHKQEWRPPKRW